VLAISFVQVMGRYTLNNWATCADIVGEYAYTSQDGQIDTFIVLMQRMWYREMDGAIIQDKIVIL
jgi:hypothetical protein